jgi:hypothetical protein
MYVPMLILVYRETDVELHVVASLLGVILIAKPTFLFGGSEHTDVGAGAGGPQVTEGQRMKAVGCAPTQPNPLGPN